MPFIPVLWGPFSSKQRSANGNHHGHASRKTTSCTGYISRFGGYTLGSRGPNLAGCQHRQKINEGDQGQVSTGRGRSVANERDAGAAMGERGAGPSIFWWRAANKCYQGTHIVHALYPPYKSYVLQSERSSSEQPKYRGSWGHVNAV